MSNPITCYYALCYRLDSQDAYLIRHSTLGTHEDVDSDGVVLDASGQMPSFRSPADLQIYAQRFGLSIEHEEPILHNLDTVVRWLKTPRKGTVDCCEFLAAWNLFKDIAYSVEAKRPLSTSKYKRIYGKLFWGNNLPSLTPPGKRYEPTWTKSEVGKLQNILSNGLQLFKDTRREDL